MALLIVPKGQPIKAIWCASLQGFFARKPGYQPLAGRPFRSKGGPFVSDRMVIFTRRLLDAAFELRERIEKP